MAIDSRTVNLLGMVNTRMKKVSSTGGGEYHGPCPMCGGNDRFIMQPNYDPPRWSCRQCHPKWGDAVELQQLLSNQGFVEAVETLGLGSQLKSNRPQMQLQSQKVIPFQQPPEKKREPIPALDNPEWIDRASNFVDWSWRNLQSGNYPGVNEYLLMDRGIDDVTADIFMLGYNPKDWNLNWGGVDVFLPEGLVIPYLDGFEGVPRKINIRRFAANAKTKYLQVKGGANWLYNHYSIKAGCIAVMVEGEIDAISIAIDVHHHKVVPVATGSTTGARWLRWAGLLSVCSRVLVAFDDDENEAGENAAKWWGQYLPNAKRLIPECHDVNDMYIQGYPLAQWIKKGLE